MAQEFGLHELAVEDARNGHQRPKIEEYGDSLFAVLHPVEMVKLDDGTDDLLVGEVDIFVGRNYVLSVRHRTQLGFAAVRARAEREPELLRHGAGVRVLRADRQRRRSLLSRCSTRSRRELEQIEEQIFVQRVVARQASRRSTR